MKLTESFFAKVAAVVLAFGYADESARARDSHDALAKQSASAPLLTTQSIVTNPHMPMEAIVGLASVYGVLLLIGASRGTKGSTLRLAFGAALTVALVNPQIRIEQRQQLPTTVAIVVDKSASQSLPGRTEMTQALYGALVKKLEQTPGLDIRTIEAGANDDNTNLFSSLGSLGETPLGAVIMLTDGQVDDVKKDAQPLNVPVHALISGKEKEYDRHIVIDQVSDSASVGQKAEIILHIADEGFKWVTEGADGDDDNEEKYKIHVTAWGEGRELGSVIALHKGTPVTMSVDISHLGANVIELKADSFPGELTEANNAATITIEGVRPHKNVLVLTGALNPDTRMWRDFLSQGTDSHFVHFAVLRPPEKDDPTPLKDLAIMPCPIDEVFGSKLDDYDLVILDHPAERGMLAPGYLDNLAKRIKKGGSLLVIADQNYATQTSLFATPLGAILPAAPTGDFTAKPYTPHITPAGERHPVTHDLGGAEHGEAHWGPWAGVVDANAAPEDSVISGAGGKPVLVLSHQEKGRVAVFLSDNLWLWSRGYKGGGPYHDLQTRLFRWLMQDPAYNEEALRLVRGQDGKLVAEEQTMADKAAPIVVTDPHGKTVTLTPRQVSPGVWRAAVPDSAAVGVYAAQREGGGDNSTVYAAVTMPHPHEFAHTVSTPAIVAPVVKAHGGYVARMTDEKGKLNVPGILMRDFLGSAAQEPRAGKDWLGIKMNKETILKGVELNPLMPVWAELALLSSLLAALWWREGERKMSWPGRSSKGGAATPAPS